VIPAALSYAFALGLVAAVNPCGFPMLPAYLSFFLGPGGEEEGLVPRVGRALRSSACVSLGFAIVFGVLGVLVRAGVTVFMAWVPWVMIVLGAGLAVLGAAGLAGRHPWARLPVRAWGTKGRGAGSMVAFGVSYAVASLTCSLPIFLVGVTGSFTRSGVVTGMGTFLAYAAGMAAVLAVVSLAVALARTSLVTVLRQAGRVADRVAPALLVVAGAYLVYYWVEDLAGSTGTSLINSVEGFQSTLTTFLTSTRTELALGVLVVVMLGAGAVLAARYSLAARSSVARGARLGLPARPGGAEGSEPSAPPGDGRSEDAAVSPLDAGSAPGKDAPVAARSS
jgi:cytochrome c biogenesis protein CcdA